MTAVDIQEQAAALRRQTRLLEDAIAVGLTGEQRRVQTALLRQTRSELATAERAERAAEAGWEPFQPASDWPWGYVADPRFLGGRTRLASALAAVPFAAGAGVLLAQRWDPIAAAIAAIVLVLGLQASIHELLAHVAQKRGAARLGPGRELRIFNAPMPANSAVAYRRARESRLFDTFTVHSPRAEDFRKVSTAESPSLGLLDPVLTGHIGRHRFLIAQWDLAKDLASL